MHYVHKNQGTLILQHGIHLEIWTPQFGQQTGHLLAGGLGSYITVNGKPETDSGHMKAGTYRWITE